METIRVTNPRPADECLICGAPMEHQTVALTFEHPTIEVIVSDVPVTVCTECGEQYVPGPVGVAIGGIVDREVRALEQRLAEDSSISPESLRLRVDDSLRRLAFA